MDIILFTKGGGFVAYATNRKLLGNSFAQYKLEVNLEATTLKSMREGSKIVTTFPIFRFHGKIGTALLLDASATSMTIKRLKSISFPFPRNRTE